MLRFLISKNIFKKFLIEVAVSSKNSLFFLSDSNDVRKQNVPSAILALGIDHYGKVAVVHPANSISQLKMTSYSSSSSLNHSSNYFPLISGVTKVLPDPVSLDRIFLANKTQLILEEDQALTLVYQGQNIQDVAFDYCQNALFIVDKGSLFRSNMKSVTTTEKRNIFQPSFPSERHVLLVTSQFYLTSNLEISHSDGFIVKSLHNGHEICRSDPTKSYNIRGISLTGNQLFMLDSLNSVVWNLDVDKTDVATCDLNLWNRIPIQEQLLDMVIVNRSIDCISNQDQRNQYLSQQPETTTISDTNDQDPCLNFCFHGDCMVTTLNQPVCHCQQNFTGTRCQVDVCYNYCLNDGACSVSTFEAVRCQCPQGFAGSRCQHHQRLQAETEIPIGFNYEHAFLITSSLCVVFLFILLAVCIVLLRIRQTNLGPEVIKKSGRTRVFSTSSTSDSKRSVNFSLFLFTKKNLLFG